MMMHRYLPTHHLRQTSGDHITLIPFTQADIRHVMPENAFKIGFTYWLQGNILDLNAKTDRKGIDLLTAKVRGTKHHLYLVDIKVNLDMQGQIHFESHCSCGSGEVHCAHVAAVLFYTLNKGERLYSQAVDIHIDKVTDIGSDKGTRVERNQTIHSHPPVLDPPLSPVDHSLNLWLEKLSQAALEISPPNTYPAKVKQRVLYLLDLKKKGEKPYLQLEVVSARQLKEGGYGKLYHLRTTTADYVLPIDRSILKWLEPLKINRSYQTSYQLQGLEGVEFLQRILATGRCYWKNKDSRVLQLGPTRTAQPVWQVTTDGTQYLIYQVEGGADAVLPLCPPWYIDSNNNWCGPLETGLPYSIASALLEAPPLKPLQIEVVRQKLAKQAPHLPQPHRFQQIRHKQIQPTICLSLFNQVFQVARQYRWECHTDEITIPMARLTFVYEKITINAYAQSALTLSYFDKNLNELIQIERDLPLEKQAQHHLQKIGFESLKSHYLYKYLKIPEENQSDLFLLLHTDPTATEQALLNFSLNKVPHYNFCYVERHSLNTFLRTSLAKS